MTNATPDFGPVWSAGLRRGGERELDDWLAFALTLCDTADEMARAAFRRDMVISTKPDRSYVTETDQAIERVIRERIADAHPGHGVIGEEYGTEAAGAAVRWYIDPIDGTHNFMRGVPLFGTLIGIERDGELQVGVISAPMLGGRWYARRGGGAWAFDAGPAGDGTPRRISVSNVASIADAQLLYGSAQDVHEPVRGAHDPRADLGGRRHERRDDPDDVDVQCRPSGPDHAACGVSERLQRRGLDSLRQVRVGDAAVALARPDELERDHESEAADVADRRMPACQLAQAGEELRAALARVRDEALVLDDVEGRVRRGARDDVAAVRAAVGARLPAGPSARGGRGCPTAAVRRRSPWP
jgi:hypothetical protein